MIGVDWGTTGFRAYRLSPGGRILKTREAPKGILSVPPGEFPAVLEEQIAGWHERPVVMSGMVGSRQGWCEVPYVQCPAGIDAVRARLAKADWGGKGGAWIVPGLSCADSAGVPDVMRGEETQLFGVMDELPDEALVCLPGTHSKWARVRARRIEGFDTHMTGELFAVLREHSLLGRTMEEGPFERRAFVEGVSRSGDDRGLLHHLFGVRTRALFSELRAAAAASYLSGILIGHELRSADAGEIFLLGAAGLSSAYGEAAALLGIRCHELRPDAAARGLYELAKKLLP